MLFCNSVKREMAGELVLLYHFQENFFLHMLSFKLSVLVLIHEYNKGRSANWTAAFELYQKDAIFLKTPGYSQNAIFML